VLNIPYLEEGEIISSEDFEGYARNEYGNNGNIRNGQMFRIDLH
jgi:hypothetical protein